MLRHLFCTYGALPSVWLATFLTTFATLLTRVIAPILMAKYLTAIILEADESLFSIWLFAGVYIIGLGIGYFADFLFVRTTDSKYETLAANFYRDVSNNSTRWMSNSLGGGLAAAFRDHLDGTINIFRLIRTEFLPFLIASLAVTIVIADYNILGASLFLMATTAQVAVSVISERVTRPFRKLAKKAYKQLTEKFSDNILNYSVIKLSGQRNRFVSGIRNLAQTEGKNFWNRHRRDILFELVGGMISTVCLGGVLFALATSDIPLNDKVGSIIIGSIFCVQSMVLAVRIGDSSQRIAEHWNKTKSTLGYINASFDCNQGEKKELTIANWPENPNISIRNISFSYSEDGITDRIFSEFNLEIEAGTHVAVVGENGAGKSSLIQLLIGFETPDVGQIAYGGIPLSNFSHEAFLGRISVAEQDAGMIASSVEENLRLFESCHDEARFRNVLDIVGLSRMFADGLLSLEQQMGELGGLVSGGQRQRVALARSLIKVADVYFFDEATSAIQEDDAAEIVRKARRFLVGKTVIFVTHSSAIADLFDFQIRISKGRGVYM